MITAKVLYILISLPPNTTHPLPAFSSPSYEHDSIAHVSYGEPGLPPIRHSSSLELAPKFNPEPTISLPPGLTNMYSLPHGDVVCSIATSGVDAALIYTGGLVNFIYLFILDKLTS